MASRLLSKDCGHAAYLSSTNGASFCQDVNSRAPDQDSDVITEGYQKWRGAAPNLISMAMINSSGHKVFIDDVDQSDILDKSISAEPMAWARKYFTDASVSWFDFVIFINGINLIRLISIVIHARNQLDLKIAIIVLITIEVTISSDDGIINIRVWRSRTPKYWLEADILARLTLLWRPI